MKQPVRNFAFAAAASLLVLGSAVCFGQDVRLSPLPFAEDALVAQELIAYSEVQKPQPLPPPDTPVPQRDQAQDQQPKPPNAEDGQAPSSQTFTGKIVKDGGVYVLKVAKDATYQLDTQSGLQQYENQSVRIVGKLDASGNTIHVVKIDLLS